MAKLVRKLFGERPEKVHVLSEVAEFNAEGVAEVSDEAAEVFLACYGYELAQEASEAQEEETEETEEEETSEAEEEEETEEVEAEPKKVQPRRTPRKR